MPYIIQRFINLYLQSEVFFLKCERFGDFLTGCFLKKLDDGDLRSGVSLSNESGTKMQMEKLKMRWLRKRRSRGSKHGYYWLDIVFAI